MTENTVPRSTGVATSGKQHLGNTESTSSSNIFVPAATAAKSQPATVAPQGPDSATQCDLKIILLGDSAVGKSKLIERFLIQRYSQYTSSTRALSIYKYQTQHPTTGKQLIVNFYDTAGQERFASMHAAYYYGAHACLLCFDLTRKNTYKNLENWHRELRKYRPNIPVILLANKVDTNNEMVNRDFKFAMDNSLEVLFVSASEGTNVVKAFDEILSRAISYKEGSSRDFMDDVMDLLRDIKDPQAPEPPAAVISSSSVNLAPL